VLNLSVRWGRRLLCRQLWRTARLPSAVMWRTTAYVLLEATGHGPAPTHQRVMLRIPHLRTCVMSRQLVASQTVIVPCRSNYSFNCAKGFSEELTVGMKQSFTRPKRAWEIEIKKSSCMTQLYGTVKAATSHNKVQQMVVWICSLHMWSNTFFLG
jgi:hypothetical protein